MRCPSASYSSVFSVALRPDFHCMIQETVSIILPGWAASCAINDDRRVFLHYSDTRSEKATPRIDRSAVKLCLFSTAALELNHTSTNECICTPRTCLPLGGMRSCTFIGAGTAAPYEDAVRAFGEAYVGTGPPKLPALIF